MPRNLMRRQDIYDRMNSRRDEGGDNRLAGVLDVLQQCMEGHRPSNEVMLNSMHTLLGMIGEEKRRRDASTLGPQQPVDIQDPRANRLIGTDTMDGLPDTPGRTVEDDANMAHILDDMNVPPEARDIVPQVLNNVVERPDGTYESADGSYQIGDREKLIYMMQRTMQEIGRELARYRGHATADVGPDLKTRLTVRDDNGKRKLVTVRPQAIDAEVV